MVYIGNSSAANFASVTKDTFSGDASETAFTLSKTRTTNGVAVYVENVRQIPTTRYSVSGTTLTFTGAPPSGTNNIYVMHHNTPVSTATHPAAQDLTAANATITGTSTLTGAVSTGAGLTVANGITLSDGNLTVASGHGIDFSANSDLDGMSGELFEHYEEGTYTPTLTPSTGGSIGVNSSFDKAAYTKVGRVVHVTVSIVSSSPSSATGAVGVSLPFTIVNLGDEAGDFLCFCNYYFTCICKCCRTNCICI